MEELWTYKYISQIKNGSLWILPTLESTSVYNQQAIQQISLTTIRLLSTSLQAPTELPYKEWRNY
jgi:hypothetical protein